MKIGILTFHWGTNYGAVLQAWCLQEYLKEQGHEVDIINYKPSQFDFSWLNIAKHPRSWKSIKRQLSNRKKELLLVQFREKHLNVTRRYSSIREFGVDIDRYDCLISGSDQVLNPSFTLSGENGKPSSVYWLGIGGNSLKRIGYAVSFGTETYPQNATDYAKPYVNGFYSIGTREKSGETILASLNYLGPKQVVPDPTLLLGAKIFTKLDIHSPLIHEDYTCIYMLRHEIKWEGNALYIDERHNPLTVEEWITTISKAKYVVTNSYHGMIVAILAHVPFAVLLESGRAGGMNDRFYTLLNKINCINRITNNVEDAMVILANPIDFSMIDLCIEEYGIEGKEFLNKYIG